MLQSRSTPDVPFTMSAPLFRLLLLLFILPFPGRSEDCGVHNWRRALGHPQKDDFIIYGITQDCHIFFARSSQIGSLAQIRTDPNGNQCFPNLIQLQLIDNSTLRLLIKQPGNRICVLTINIPPLNILFGPNAFTYSLSSSMPYARCSHAAPPLALETDLAFPDSAYSDVVYFIDPTSSGPRWTARQFMLNENDTLAYLDKFTIANGDRSESFPPPIANDFVVSIDADKNFLYKRNRFRRNITYECAFDLLFRPNTVVFGSSFSSMADPLDERSSWLNSFAVDKDVMIFAETDKQSSIAPTRLYVHSTQGGNTEAHCIALLPYRVELGIFSLRTIEQLTDRPLPKFGLARNAPPRTFLPRPHAVRPTPPPTSGVPEKIAHAAETSSRLTQTTSTTMRTTTTTRRITTTTTVEELPTEPPDESEDLTEEDAALYDTVPDEEVKTLAASGSITLPSTTASTTATRTWPVHQVTQTGRASAATLPPPTGTPLNDTLQAKSSSLPFSLISVIVACLALSA
ncbi:hypothetical protein PMAYCL1PPCAC_15712 [Pristionchus mayeri]|uniref:Uncharacterized protein n=1 Tax=Pristionchus mayeri TaxID=1317129 RepID=A0AAN5CJF3_9BILA|nr:hypothetical protein PMAYCL1PPCAC_15712 [Pristionchus mayeri]